MKFTFGRNTTGSMYDATMGLDFLTATGEVVTDAAATRGWRFNPTDSLDRMSEISRARDLATMSESDLQRKYNPYAGMEYTDPESSLMSAPDTVPSLQHWRNKGFNEDKVSLMTAEEANAKYGVKGHLQFQQGVSNLEAWILQQRKLEEMKFNYVLNQAEGTQFWKGLGIEMGTAILDPINVAAGILFPAYGAETLIARFGWQSSKVGSRFVTGGLSAIYGTTAVEPVIYGAASQEQADYGAVDSLLNVAFAGIAGGGLHVIGGKVVDTVSGITRGRHLASIKTAINQLGNGQSVEVSPLAHGGELQEVKVVETSFDTLSADELATKQAEANNNPVPPAAENQASPIVEHTPAQDVTKSLTLIEKLQAAANLTSFAFKKLVQTVPDLSEAVAKATELGQKNNYAFRLTTKDGQVVLVRQAEGQPLKLFDTTELKGEDIGAEAHQAMLMHGVDPTGASLDYHGSYKLEDGTVTHVVDMAGVKFDPEMNQKQTILAAPNEVAKTFAGTPLAQVFSGYVPKGAGGVSTQFYEGPLVGAQVSKQTPEQLSQISGVDEVINAENLKQTGEQAGTQQGGFFTDAATGQNFYVKFPAKPELAINEFIAAVLYRMLGVDMPTTRLVAKDGKIVGVASEVTTDAKPLSPDEFVKLPQEVREQFIKDAIVDMYLGNWDVVGNAPNWNIYLRPDGTVGRLDPGGALLYRAQGGPKELSAQLDELKTMLDPKKSPAAAKVFNSVDNFDELQQEAISRILSLEESDVRQLADMVAFEQADELVAGLAARQNALASKNVGLAKAAVKGKSKVLFFNKAEAVAYLKKQAQRFLDSFTPAERKALKDYGGSSYSEINRYLREGFVKGKTATWVVNQAEAILEAFKKSFLQKDTIVFRGGTPAAVFDGINGQKLADHTDLASGKAMIGGVVEVKGIISTSLDHNFSAHWGAKDTPFLRIEAPKGSSAIYGHPDVLPLMGSEAELLLPHKSKFRIKDVRKMANSSRIEMVLELLPPDWKPAPQVPKKLAIKIAQAHQEEVSNALHDSTTPIDFESDSAAQTTLKPNELTGETAVLEKSLDDILLDINAEMANMDNDLIAAFAKELEAINKQGEADLKLAEDLYKAAQAAAVCIKGAG